MSKCFSCGRFLKRRRYYCHYCYSEFCFYCANHSTKLIHTPGRITSICVCKECDAHPYCRNIYLYKTYTVYK